MIESRAVIAVPKVPRVPEAAARPAVRASIGLATSILGPNTVIGIIIVWDARARTASTPGGVREGVRVTLAVVFRRSRSR